VRVEKDKEEMDDWWQIVTFYEVRPIFIYKVLASSHHGGGFLSDCFYASANQMPPFAPLGLAQWQPNIA
jgi:hypothetical protein